MARCFGESYYPNEGYPIKYNSLDIFISIIKEQCSDQESEQKLLKGCEMKVNDGLP